MVGKTSSPLFRAVSEAIQEGHENYQYEMEQRASLRDETQRLNYANLPELAEDTAAMFREILPFEVVEMASGKEHVYEIDISGFVAYETCPRNLRDAGLDAEKARPKNTDGLHGWKFDTGEAEKELDPETPPSVRRMLAYYHPSGSIWALVKVAQEAGLEIRFRGRPFDERQILELNWFKIRPAAEPESQPEGEPDPDDGWPYF